MLRNPVERAYSGFQHVKRYNVKENYPEFKSAWDISEKRYFDYDEMTPASRYKELGLYYKQVKSYLEQFKNVHIIIYDDYKKDFQKEMNERKNMVENPDSNKLSDRSIEHMKSKYKDFDKSDKEEQWSGKYEDFVVKKEKVDERMEENLKWYGNWKRDNLKNEG